MSPPSADASPVTFPMSGHFSDEDIHELLGAMGDHMAGPLATMHHEEEPSHEEHQVGSLCTPGDTDEYPASTTTEHEGEEAISAEARAQARSERKRSREKQRRSDVNKQFADLTQLLRRIEAEDLEGEGIAGLATIPSGGPTNRVDLIARTIAVLERMHEMSSKRRREVVDLNRQLEEMKKMAEDTAARLKEATVYQQGPPKPVMMMVPMMVNPGTTAGATPAMGTAAPGAFAMATPFMQQPNMFMPQMAAGMPQMQMSMPPPQPFPHVMFGSTAPPPPPAPAPSADQPSSPQQQGQKQPSINGGSNLAHCA